MRYTLSLLFLLVSLVALSQSRLSAVSGNSKFVARCSYEGKDKPTGTHTYKVKVYSVAYKSLIQEIFVRFPNKNSIDSLALSNNGKLLYVYQEPESRVYNVRTGQLVVKFTTPVVISFATQDNFFVVTNHSWITAYDSYTAEELEHYQISADNGIHRIEITPDDSHIICVTGKNQVLVWKKGFEKVRKKFYADDMVISQDGKQITMLRSSPTNLMTFTYSLPEFARVKRQAVDKTLRDKARAETLELRKQSAKGQYPIVKASRFLKEGYKLSQVGNYLAFLAQSPQDEKEVIVMNTISGEVILDDIAGTMKQAVDLKWYNDSLMIPANAVKAGIFNARQQHYDNELELEFFGESTRIKDKKLLQGRRVSNNFKLSSFDQDGKILLRANKENGLQVNVENHRTLGFSPNSHYFFIENYNSGQAGYIETEDVEAGREPKITYFSEEKRAYQEEQVQEEVKPSGIDYNRITGFEHISEAKPSDSLRIVMKTVEAGKKSGVQIQLIDKNGVYYYGAGADDFRRIWCNLMVKGSDGKVKQIDDFEVTENRGTDTLPNAVAVVMDYSGSMGWNRVDALQDGAEKFIKAKKGVDEYALVKYDDHVVLSSKLSGNQQKLLRKLYLADYSQFGGGTALLDAVNAGIFAVKGAENVGKKIVLALTDGFENSSLATRNEVVANAIANGVSIYTIGFGALVDDAYLKSLSYTTFGGHYHIYQTPDFDWVFSDIYSKATNYYSVNYNTPDKGSQVYLLKVCLENGVADSMVVEYDNNPADVQLLLSSDDTYKANPVKAYGASQIDIDDFDYPEIKDFSKIKSKQPLQPKKFKLDEDKIAKIEEEFVNISLPRFNFYYDQTVTVQETDRRITELANFLKKYPEIRLEISGHTDNSGTVEYNEKLSQDRAEMAKKLLTDKGIKASRLEAKGFGETVPVAENTTEQGRGSNRRVEFRIIDEKH